MASIEGKLQIKDTLQMATGAIINEFSTDGTLAGNSDTAVPTEQAVKTYVDASSTSPGGADTQVQFNDSGSFGGDSALTYNKTTDVLSVKQLAFPAGWYDSIAVAGDYFNIVGKGTGHFSVEIQAPQNKDAELWLTADGGAGTWSPNLVLYVRQDEIYIGCNAPLDFKVADVVNGGQSFSAYIRFQTISQVPEITTVGGCDLKISSSSGNVIFGSKLSISGAITITGDQSIEPYFNLVNTDIFAVSNYNVFEYTDNLGGVPTVKFSIDRHGKGKFARLFLGLPTDYTFTSIEQNGGWGQWTETLGGSHGNSSFIFKPQGTGTFGIGAFGGANNPLAMLSVLSTSEQLRLSHTYNTHYASFTVDGSGDLLITATGGNVIFEAASTEEARINSSGLKLKSGADINEFSIDGTLVGNSDDAVPTEKAVKTYVDTAIAGVGGGNMVLVEKKIFSAESSYTWTGLSPSKFYKVFFQLDTSGNEDIGMRFNGETSNYDSDSARFTSGGVTHTGGPSGYMELMPSNNGTHGCNGEIGFGTKWALTNNIQAYWQIYGTAPSTGMQIGGGRINTSVALTSMTILAASGTLNGVAVLYEVTQG